MVQGQIFDEVTTPLGLMEFEASDEAIVRLWFAEKPPKSIHPQQMRQACSTPIGEWLKTELIEYFSGQRQAFTVPLAPQGTPFQREAWMTLQAIPFGQTISYSQQAAWFGRHKAVRAVANANGANPLPILIPCHRVVAKNGGLGGYGPGLDKKAWLIQHEQQHP